MLFILLNDFLCVRVVLKDFFVLAACKENVLFVVGRMKFDAKRCPSVCEASYHFSSLCIPKLNYSVVASG